LPLALARPALSGPPGAAEKRLIANVKTRVERWDQIAAGSNPFRSYYTDKKEESLGTESILNALILVNNDVRRAGGLLGEPTRNALAHLWEQQGEDGAWPWLDFGLNPWENDATYYGAALAALAVGTAGKDYYDQADVRPRVVRLKAYLRAEFANQPLHHRVAALWASSRLPGALDEPARRALVEELRRIQEADGGWSLARLGQRASGPDEWSTSRGVYPDGQTSDGYATGLVVLAWKGAGLRADDPSLKKALNWLASHEDKGTWPTLYLNKKRDPQENAGKFMRDAATGFAILALTEASR
jgi:squalene-hopene/tetraprenyl-beta-curcumene cyclase